MRKTLYHREEKRKNEKLWSEVLKAKPWYTHITEGRECFVWGHLFEKEKGKMKTKNKERGGGVANIDGEATGRKEYLLSTVRRYLFPDI